MGDLHAVPALLLLVLAIGLAVGLVSAGQILLHRWIREDLFLKYDDVAVVLIPLVGTTYAIVLGFMTVIVWQQYESTRERVAFEAAATTDVWHSSAALPASVRTRVQHDMLAYARTMLDVDWPGMQRGTFTRQGDALIMDATTTAGTYVPVNSAESNAQGVVLHLLSELHDARLRRVDSSFSSVSWFEWLVLDVGALAVTVLCFLPGPIKRGVHFVVTGLVATMIATMFVLLFELNTPFRGDLAISSQPWRATVAHMEWMDAMSRGPTKMQMPMPAPTGGSSYGGY